MSSDKNARVMPVWCVRRACIPLCNPDKPRHLYTTHTTHTHTHSTDMRAAPLRAALRAAR
jgi:hypothetical protein